MTVGGGRHELWLTDDQGVRLFSLDRVVSFEYARTVNAVGSFSLVLPRDFDDTLLTVDYRVEFWYAAPDGNLYMDFLGFIQEINYETSAQGLDRFTVRGGDPLTLLNRRIVAYALGSAQANKSGNADDLMKAVVRENMGASAAAARQFNSSFFTVAGDTSLGPTVSKEFSRRNVLEVLFDLANAAERAGTPVYYDVVRLDSAQVEFRTFVFQPGADRRESASANPVVFSQQRGNLLEPVLAYNWWDEANVVYVGGQGAGGARTVAEREDTTRSGRSVWGRRETWRDQRNTNAAASLNAEGDNALNQSRPRERFHATLVDTRATQYGKDWFAGDRITANAYGKQFEGLVRSVHVTRGEDGSVNVNARLELEA